MTVRCIVCKAPDHLHGRVCQHCRSQYRATVGARCNRACAQCGTRLRHEPPDPTNPLCGFCIDEQEQAA